MISFMVLGGPRSATTWAANWLTTDTTICLHDPLLEYPIEQLQRLTFPGRSMLGVACTSLCLYPDWVNSQKCPKVILYRETDEINRSLRTLGLVELIKDRHLKRLEAIEGALWVRYESLFRPAGAMAIAKHLRTPWDANRHYLLYQMRVEPMWKHLNVGREAVVQLVKRIGEAR